VRVSILGACCARGRAHSAKVLFRRYWPITQSYRPVLYLDTPLEPQLYRPNQLWESGTVMGESWEPYRTHMGASPGITLILPGAPPASAGPRNIRQAYAQRAEGSFPVFGPLWKVAERLRALSGGQDRPPFHIRLAKERWRNWLRSCFRAYLPAVAAGAAAGAGKYIIRSGCVGR
jgi:hypothetical protein